MTRTPFYRDDTLTLWQGDALEVMTSLDSGSVNSVVTSPPYYGLRDYGNPSQYGLEDTPAQYVETMRALFSETRRVLADDGTLWLNLGDSYSARSSNNGGYSNKSKLAGYTSPDTKGRISNDRHTARKLAPDVAAKNLLGIPWRVAFALQDDGWILRNAIIWHKPNAMPESVTDRLSTRYEHLFLFSKKPRYWCDLDPIREPLAYPDAADGTRVFGGVNKAAELQTGSSARRTGNNVYGGKGHGHIHPQTGKDADPAHSQTHPDGKNPGDVWTITTQPFPGAHFAVMPRELARRAIVSGCKPGGTVLDPFSGSGTTGLAAQNTGRRYVGIDLSADYLRMSLETRLHQQPLDLEGTA
jgi:site-specific DNA-methyltransferase (cytosine-N4-specific)